MTSTRKILSNGTIQWVNDTGDLHREDGPAVELANGTKLWWLNGERHRVDGPAVEFAAGYKEWWLNGIYVSEKEHAWRVRHRYFDEIDGMPEKLKMEYLLVFG